MAETQLFEQFTQGRTADAFGSVIGHGVQTDVEPTGFFAVKGVKTTNFDMFFDDAYFFIETSQADTRSQTGKPGPYDECVIDHG